MKAMGIAIIEIESQSGEQRFDIRSLISFFLLIKHKILLKL